jgi:hypothetical protein
MIKLLIFAGILLCVFIIWRYWYKKKFSTPGLVRLGAYLRQNREYKIFIGFPTNCPKEWSLIRKYDDDVLITSAMEQVPISDVSSFVVAYSNGEILDSEEVFAPLPEGLFFVEPETEEKPHMINTEDFVAGKAFVEIEFGRCLSRPREPCYYSTTVRNISGHKLRVTKFGAYSKKGNQWTLNTITRSFFTVEQFNLWYAVDSDGWIKPGQEVMDPNNYGGPVALWAYYCVSDKGEEFIAGKVVDWYKVQNGFSRRFERI